MESLVEGGRYHGTLAMMKTAPQQESHERLGVLRWHHPWCRFPLGGIAMISRPFLSLAFAIGLFTLGSAGGLDSRASELVRLDVPAMVVAEPINPAVVESPTLGGKLFRLRIPVSTFIAPQFRGQVSEYCIEVTSPQQTMRVVDFWPKMELYSDVQGTVAIQSSYHKDSHFAFKVSGGYEPFIRGNAEGQLNEQRDVQQSYQKKPSLQVLTAAGTANRGYGVFYKFRPGPVSQLEGEREVAILVEVPQTWRADLLRVTMRAVGYDASGDRVLSLGECSLWSTVHQEGDQAAAALAHRYVTQERGLRALAASSQRAVEEKSLPTVWHRVGAALEVVEPRIPDDYLQSVLFAAPAQGWHRPQTARPLDRLPVDLRIAILDYWDARDRLLRLAQQGVN